MSEDLSLLKDVKLMVATPSVDEQCHVAYFMSCMKLLTQCETLKIPVHFEFELGNSLIVKARNNLATRFMKSSFTHLLMIDSDIAFNYEDVIKLILLDKDVIGASVSKKEIKWQTIKNTIQRNPSIQAEDLPYFGCSENYVPYEDKHGNKTKLGIGKTAPHIATLGVPIRAASVGTGLILIKRSVLKKMQEAYPELEYKSIEGERRVDQNPLNYEAYEKELAQQNENATFKSIFSYFELLRTENNFMTSEDVSFCQRVNDMGMEVWAWPWMKTIHYGAQAFPADLRKWMS